MTIFKRSEEDEVNGLIWPPTSNVFTLLTAFLSFDACVFVGRLGVYVPSLTCTIALICSDAGVRAGSALRYFSLAACVIPLKNCVLASLLYVCSRTMSVHTPLNFPTVTWTVGWPWLKAATTSGGSCLIACKYCSIHATYFVCPADMYGSMLPTSVKCCCHKQALSASMYLF